MAKKIFQFRIGWIFEVAFFLVGLIVVILYQENKDIPTESPSLVQDTESVSDPSVTSSPSIDQAVMCLNIDGNQPDQIKTQFSSLFKRIYCYVSFKDSFFSQQTISHLWTYQNEIEHEKSFAIGPSQKQTWSYMDMSPQYKGPWIVKIVDQQNNILKKLEFKVL